MPIELKSPQEIEVMREANLLVFKVLGAVRELVKPGVTTRELDEVARDIARDAGAECAFLGYPSSHADIPSFPGAICASVDDQIVHGIPNENPLAEGSILSVDFGCKINDFYGDSAVTIPVGRVSSDTEKLLDITQESLDAAISQCVPGKRIGDIGHAVQSVVEPAGFGVVREFVGHGIGRAMHEPPHVPNFGIPGQGRVLRPGMVLAIEPMVTQGNYQTKILDDGWTAVTKDGSLSAHFEHTVAITENGPIVLSLPEGRADR
jgi:methionyl aminopeptidase